MFGMIGRIFEKLVVNLLTIAVIGGVVYFLIRKFIF